MDVDPRSIRLMVERFLDEDVGHGDVTTDAIVDGDARAHARIEAREGFVVAGLDAARMCFEVLDASGGWRAEVGDGSRVDAGAVIARIDAAARAILTAERTALNLLQRLSAVATTTARFVAAVEGTPARIIDTRKTTPGLRVLEKAAVRAGGGGNHRFGLDDGVLIKDNHIRAAGGVSEAVERARNQAPHGLVVEVEVTDLRELDEALGAGAEAVLLDNMSPDLVREAVLRGGGKATFEASGGINLDNVRVFAEAGVDLISVGALTHSAGSVDIALEVE
ncbi:MAG TPA: carboxylating nicotinate-nucleotide diphosphorylase [Actinomycetota bacterium]|nr:carboxylating nicotinate-nucleotide diphosphorylase [Actinomycetota bacterium]